MGTWSKWWSGMLFSCFRLIVHVVQLFPFIDFFVVHFPRCVMSIVLIMILISFILWLSLFVLLVVRCLSVWTWGSFSLGLWLSTRLSFCHLCVIFYTITDWNFKNTLNQTVLECVAEPRLLVCFMLILQLMKIFTSFIALVNEDRLRWNNLL